MTSKVVSKLRANVNNRKVPTRFMMLMSSYVHYLKTFCIREGSFRYLDGNRIKEIPERAFENTPNLKVMYVTTES